MGKLVKADKHVPVVDLYNIGAPEARAFTLNCPACRRAHSDLNLKVGNIVNCECGKKFDCVFYSCVSDPKQLQEYFDATLAAGVGLSFDFETDGDEASGNDPFAHKIVGVSFCRYDQPGTAIYVPIGHIAGGNMPADQVKEICAPAVEKIPMGAHNFFGMELPWVYVKWGVMPNVECDTMILSWLDDPNRTHRFDPRSIALKEMAKELWDINVIELKQLVDLKTSNFSVVPLAAAVPYGCQDSILGTRIRNQLQAKIAQEQSSILQLEMSLIPITAKMYLRGIMLDAQQLAEGATKLDKEIEELEFETFKEMGFVIERSNNQWTRPFDLGSPKRVSEHLFFKMGLPYDQRDIGASGVPSSDKDSLESYRDAYPVVDKMLSYRAAVHMRENFLAALPNYINAITGYIHGFFQPIRCTNGKI